jgi:hypothetical protein
MLLSSENIAENEKRYVLVMMVRVTGSTISASR